MLQNVNKLLDERGLKTFWEQNKIYIQNQVAASSEILQKQIEEYFVKKLFVGETLEYNLISDKLDIGALVILTDGVGGIAPDIPNPDIPNAGGTTAKLEQAILGTMVLGQA